MRRDIQGGGGKGYVERTVCRKVRHRGGARRVWGRASSPTGLQQLGTETKRRSGKWRGTLGAERKRGARLMKLAFILNE